MNASFFLRGNLGFIGALGSPIRPFPLRGFQKEVRVTTLKASYDSWQMAVAPKKDDRTPANLLSQQRMPGSPTTYIPSSAWMHRLGWLRFSYAAIRGCKIFRLSGFQPSSILGCFSYFQSSGGSTGLHIHVSRFQGSRVTCSALL